MKQIIATGNLYGETTTIKQVSKAAAKKHFAAGNQIYLQSSNMYPFGVWQSVCPIELDKSSLLSKIELFNKWGEYLGSKQQPNEITEFELKVSEYTYYNCDSERGKYVHFYIKAV